MTFVRRYGIFVLGVVVLLLGVWQFVWSMVLQTTFNFGWTAYAPLTSTTFSPVPWSLPFAIALVVVGVALIAGWIAIGVGRRSLNAGPIRRFVPAGVGILILVVIAVSLFVPSSRGGEYLIGNTDYAPFVDFQPPDVIIGDVIGVLIVSLAIGGIAWWVGEQIGRRGARAVSRPSQA
jgi:hypothetical protein